MAISTNLTTTSILPHRHCLVLGHRGEKIPHIEYVAYRPLWTLYGCRVACTTQHCHPANTNTSRIVADYHSIASLRKQDGAWLSATEAFLCLRSTPLTQLSLSILCDKKAHLRTRCVVVDTCACARNTADHTTRRRWCEESESWSQQWFTDVCFFTRHGWPRGSLYSTVREEQPRSACDKLADKLDLCNNTILWTFPAFLR